MSLVLTYTFVRLQGTEHRVRSNARHDTAALQAARTGASAALRLMSSPNWEGVDSPLRAVVGADDEGTLHYEVTWWAPHQLDDAALPEDGDAWDALHVLVRSKGIWVAHENPAYRVERTVEVVARLEPRLPGRIPVGRDDGTANDLSPNPPAWRGVESLTLQARKSGHSLRLEPGCRIDGDVFLAGGIRLFEDPRWGRAPRAAYLAGLGDDLTDGFTGSLTRWPHPLPGTLTVGIRPDHRLREDLDRLHVSWQIADGKPPADASRWSVPLDAFREYRIYQGGPTYRAPRVRWSLRNTTLQPSEDNPLGIFVCDGDLRVSDRVTVIGTLVVAGKLIVEGRDVTLAPFRGYDLEGNALVSDPSIWPRLPAVMAERLEIERDARLLIDGAVILEKDFEMELPEHEPMVEADAPIAAGTGAVAQPISAILSEVRLPAGVALPDFSPGRYAIWLGSREWSRYEDTGATRVADVAALDEEAGQPFLSLRPEIPLGAVAQGGSLTVWISGWKRWFPVTRFDTARGRIFLPALPDRRSLGARTAFRLVATRPRTGGWFPIIEHDPARRTLTVLGEAPFPSGVEYRIAPAIGRCAYIRGVVSAERFRLNAPPSWKHWNAQSWYERFEEWSYRQASASASGNPHPGSSAAASSDDDRRQAASDDGREDHNRDSDENDRRADDDRNRVDHRRAPQDHRSGNDRGDVDAPADASQDAEYGRYTTGDDPHDGVPRVSFATWLHDPAHCPAGNAAMRRRGLHIRPTLHIWNASDAPLRLTLPLFAPYRHEA
ncbi:MAG: hypothetical protein D6725_17720, partial [Planctomycetota bacterium]